MVKMNAVYQGQKRCKAEHESSKTTIETDAPKDNQGLGESFSPTDLVATALGTCILTTIAINAERDGVDVKNAKMSVEKHMVSDPRRIGLLRTVIQMPKSVPVEYRSKLESIGNNCPVLLTLNPNVKVEIQYQYNV